MKYDVRIAMRKPGFELVKSKMNDSKDSKGFFSRISFFEERTECVVFGWDYIKWDSHYAPIKKFYNCLSELDNMVYSDEDNRELYGYRLCELREDGAGDNQDNLEGEYEDILPEMYSDSNIYIEPDTDVKETLEIKTPMGTLVVSKSDFYGFEVRLKETNEIVSSTEYREDNTIVTRAYVSDSENEEPETTICIKN